MAFNLGIGMGIGSRGGASAPALANNASSFPTTWVLGTGTDRATIAAAWTYSGYTGAENVVITAYRTVGGPPVLIGTSTVTVGDLTTTFNVTINPYTQTGDVLVYYNVDGAGEVLLTTLAVPAPLGVQSVVTVSNNTMRFTFDAAANIAFDTLTINEVGVGPVVDQDDYANDSGQGTAVVDVEFNGTPFGVGVAYSLSMAGFFSYSMGALPVHGNTDAPIQNTL